MLRLFRVRAACLATTVLLAVGTVGASLESLSHVDAAHADACLTVSAAHDASAHRIGAGSDPHEGGTPHCLACHWARSLRFGVEAIADAGRPDDSFTLTAARTARCAPAPVRSNLQPRSPPRDA